MTEIHDMQSIARMMRQQQLLENDDEKTCSEDDADDLHSSDLQNDVLDVGEQDVFVHRNGESEQAALAGEGRLIEQVFVSRCRCDDVASQRHDEGLS